MQDESTELCFIFRSAHSVLYFPPAFLLHGFPKNNTTHTGTNEYFVAAITTANLYNHTTNTLPFPASECLEKLAMFCNTSFFLS